MALGLLADDQCIQRLPGQGRGLGDATDQGVGAEGEASDGHRAGLHQFQHLRRQQRQAQSTEADGLAVDVVTAGAAGSQGEVAVAVGPRGEQLQQQLPLFGAGGRQGNGCRHSAGVGLSVCLVCA